MDGDGGCLDMYTSSAENGISQQQGQYNKDIDEVWCLSLCTEMPWYSNIPSLSKP